SAMKAARSSPARPSRPASCSPQSATHASTASACLRRLSLWVHSVSRAHACSRPYAKFVIEHLSVPILHASHRKSQKKCAGLAPSLPRSLAPCSLAPSVPRSLSPLVPQSLVTLMVRESSGFLGSAGGFFGLSLSFYLTIMVH